MFEKSLEKFNLISSIFGVRPVKSEKEAYSTWIYEVEENENYFDFINIFIDMIELKSSELQNLNIKREDISLWMLYEYDQQCNMEFDPERLKRIAANKITLCISCWKR